MKRCKESKERAWLYEEGYFCDSCQEITPCEVEEIPDNKEGEKWT